MPLRDADFKTKYAKHSAARKHKLGLHLLLILLDIS